MKIAGKCKPEEYKLRELYNRGYKNVELYLTKQMLDTRTDIIKVCKNSKMNIVSVHTPHMNLDVQDSMKYFKQSDLIADSLDATLVLHSNPYSTFSLINFYSFDEIESDKFGYENHPDISSHFIENYQLKQGYPLVLDTAHLHIGEKDYMKFIRNILSTYNKKYIPIIHLNDGTKYIDGLHLGEGEINYEKIVNIIQDCNYNGYVVLEVPRKDRYDALDIVENLLVK